MRLTIFSLILVAGNVLAGSWPCFRGPSGQGYVQGNIPQTWSEAENVTWRTDLPGRAHSSPVLGDGKIWLTTAFETPATEAEAKVRRAKSPETAKMPLNVLSMLKLHVLCVDQKSGKLLENITVITEKDPQWVHQLNSYASPTPILEGNRLYCHFGAFGTCCVDTESGKLLWLNQETRINHENGPGSSPVLVGDNLIFHCDGSDEQYIIALNKTSGKEAWKTKRSGKMHDNPQFQKAYGTPLVLKRDGKDVVYSPAADWLYAYDAANGAELWKLPYNILGFSNVAAPVAKDDMLYFSTCFMQPAMIAVKLGPKPEEVWRFTKSVSKMPSPILVDGGLYFVSDRGGLLTCLEATTGELRWKERLKGDFSASPIAAPGRIYFFSQDGETTVIEDGKTFKVLAKNTLDGRLMASPAIDGDTLFMRTDKALYRIESK